MNSGREEEWEDRLADLERRLQEVEARLGSARDPSIAPPPVYDMPEPPALPSVEPTRTSEPGRAAFSGGQTSDGSQAPGDERKPFSATPEDAEYTIGTRVLPRIGAGVFLLGVAYLIGLGISRGWITPLVLFIGAVLLCSAFVVVGLIKREEREEFGQLLVGIGSCGLYITFAGGHVWQELYSAELLVALFMALSVLNLAFSFWRASRTFLGIGMLGGFSAVLMPLAERQFSLLLLPERQFATVAILHFCILLPCAAVAARHRWMYAGLAIWFLALPSALALSGSPLAWQVEVLVVYANALAAIFVYAYGFRVEPFDPKAWMLTGLAFAAGIHAFALQGGVAGAGHVALFGALVAGMGYLLRGREAVPNALLLGAVLVLLIITPYGWTGVVRVGIQLVLSALLSGTYIATRLRAALALSGVLLALALASYIAIVEQGALQGMREPALLYGFLAAVCLFCYALSRGETRAETAAMLASVLALPIVLRLVFVHLGLPTGFQAQLTLFFTLESYGLVMALAALVLGWRQLSYLGWCLFAACWPLYLAAQLFEFPIQTELTALSMGLALLVILATASAKLEPGGDLMRAVGAALALPIVSRACVVVANLWGAQASATVSVVWTVYAIGLIAAGFALSDRHLRVLSLALFGVTAAKVILVDLSVLEPAVRVAVLMFVGVAMIAGGYWYIRSRSGTDEA